ncbi:rod shape-determining protein RodA [Larsenimonas rhizosphaerae]|uniref:Peptidoglycan glycosyltransferase MrdB n=1 Tax=Larsenimonas rhizosphaerae TaxID=2944682 RepID=A0AA41ZFD8_9GAMM|nr:rod shape-determining protein RodA [Larsenimonas rhizosphaerae]MCM2130836.1 rod shape-determining protein RodA [Larsenimonas rhizosphaerae]MCX2523540.1 rod shape-determining protein RodA [Larsenimonas rhizosphaerae]
MQHVASRSRRRHKKRFHWRSWRIDPWLTLGLLVLVCSGLVVLYSASGESRYLVEAQTMRFVAAFAVMAVVAQIPPHLLMRMVPLFYLSIVAMLVAVDVIGSHAMGATRWLEIPGVVRFQPSELMKIVMPMTIAAYLSKRDLPPNWTDLGICLFIMGLPVALIAKQPDLGTSLLVASSAVFVVLLGGLSWRLVGFFAVLALAALPLLWLNMHGYQKQRVLTFLNPESDPLGAGWNIIQSKTAIGSGGISGKGWMEGTQSQLEFLPERHTDFIVAVLGEEFGLIGMLLLLLCYLLIICRGLFMASRAGDTYGRLLAGSLILTFFVYVFVNIGMVSGLLPVVGVPLPLVSYGGTASVTLMAGFGILMSVYTHRKSSS